jgi:hypothetical protein
MGNAEALKSSENLFFTPLILSTFPANEVATFGSDTPLGRASRKKSPPVSYFSLRTIPPT